MNTIETLDPTPFKHLIMTVGELPASYLDSMTYYEMLAWICNYVEKNVVPTVNNNAEAIKEIQEWISTLDLQDEVDHKLDEMAESGELAEIIALYLQVASVLAYNTVTDLKEAENVIDGSLVQTYGFHTINDGGGAKYLVRQVTNQDNVNEIDKIALADENLIAVLITDYKIDVKQLGAYGDNSHDDTTVIQYALTNWDNVYIPKGTYIISEELKIKNDNNIHGDGEVSCLKFTYTYTDSIKYLFNHDNEFLQKITIENLQITTVSETNYCGGIKITGGLRGNSLRNLWFFTVSNPIYLGDKIWGEFDLENIHAYYFPESEIDESKPIGIYAEGNTIYGRNIEIIGQFSKGIYLNTVSVCNIDNANVAGSEDINMTNAFTIESSHFVNLANVWIEKTLDSNGNNNTKSINILNSDTISLNNINCSNGSIYADGSTNVKTQNIRYGNANAGIRTNNKSEIESDLSSCGRCNYQANIVYFSGNVNIVGNVDSKYNLFNNSIFLTGIDTQLAKTNASFVTLTDDTTNQYSGDRCINVSAGDYQGVQHTFAEAEVGKTYTALALVKTSSNISNIYFTVTNADVSNVYPCTAGLSHNGWQVIKLVFNVTAANPVIKLVQKSTDTSTNGVFLLDSFSIFEGYHNSEFPPITSKKLFMNINKVYNSSSPASGTWTKGDMIWNNLASSQTVLYWKYNGSTWTAVNI